MFEFKKFIEKSVRIIFWLTVDNHGLNRYKEIKDTHRKRVSKQKRHKTLHTTIYAYALRHHQYRSTGS